MTTQTSPQASFIPSSEAIQFTLHPEGIAELSFDLPGEKVNKLTFEVMKSLSDHLAKIHGDQSIKLLMFTSKKKNVFIAGADISEIQHIHSQEDGESKASQGQDILQQIADLPIPTLCVIDGACLGGGLEFALACDFRMVSDNPKLKLGLPEVNLGIIPGFGGTQRLPRLLGLDKALPLILTGKQVNGAKALKLGLADIYVASAFLNTHVHSWANKLLSSQERKSLKNKRKAKKSWVSLLLQSNPLGLSFLFKQAKKNVMAKTKGKYPAPLAAIKAVRKGWGQSLKKALKIEAKEFGHLAHSQVCKNLIQIYYSSEELKKDSGVENKTPELKKINQAGVLGAGLMGGGIAWLFADKDISIRLKDLHWEALAKGMESAQKIYNKLMKIRRRSSREVNLKMQRITPSLSNTGWHHQDVVVEAIVEDMQIKKKVLQELESHIPQDCLICSNTSSLSITEMASGLKNPKRFVGMHFFSPVNRMPLVEVIPGEHSSQEAIASTVALAKRLHKTPIVVKNCPGFLVNRILIPYVNEAIHLLQDGVTIATIDQLAEDFGMPLGPLALADEVGLDVGYKVAKILEQGYGQRMKCAGLFEELHHSEELLGKKSNHGFYTYNGKEKSPSSVVEKLTNNYRLNHAQHHFVSQKEALDRLMLIMVNEAARCIEEKVVANHKYLDMGMILGCGFPPFKGGVLRYADELGIDYVALNLNNLSHKFGERFQPSELLLQMAEQNQTFY